MFAFLLRWFPSLAPLLDPPRRVERSDPPPAPAADPRDDLERPAGPAPGAQPERPADDEAAPTPEPEAIDDDDDAWWRPRAVEDGSGTAPPADEPVNRGLYEQLVRVLDDANLEVPRMPHVAQRALLALRDENACYRRVADLVGQDPALTGEVLRVANSVMYRAIREIRQLDQAFARLGVRTLRSVVLGASFKGLLIRTGGAGRSLGEELWRRALAGAAFMRLMAGRFDMPEDEAYLAGLLHDVGLLVVLKIVHEHQQYHGRPVSRPVFERVGREWHEQIGLRVARAWNLPEPLPSLVGAHHDEPGDDDPLCKHRLLIQLADAACEMLGYAPYVAHDFFHLPCARRLGIVDDPATRALLRAAPEVIRESIEGVSL